MPCVDRAHAVATRVTIPPVIHYVWVGDQPLPRKYGINIASWRETNPEFEIRAWTNETIETKNPYLERCFA